MSLAIPAWRKRLVPGSFRGAPFFVDAVQTQVGRRVVQHEYPQRDTLYPEDLGLKADAFTVEAIVIGLDYIAARDVLIAALKKRGPGKLKHPYYGERTVALASPARISETAREGGMARFSLDFVDAGENTEPSATLDTQHAVEAAADLANDAIAQDFADTLALDGWPAFVESAAQARARVAFDALDAARKAIVPDRSVLSDYLAASQKVADGVGALIREPAAFAQEVLGLVGALKGLARTPRDAANSYRQLLGHGSTATSVPAGTPARAVQAANQVAIAGLFRRAAMVEAARVASRDDYDTYDQAISARDALATALDDEASGLVPGVGDAQQAVDVDAGLYGTLTALRVALVRDLTERAIDAPRITAATLPSTLPALVAAHRIHGDARRADEIVSRNPVVVRHPGFVPGGVALEVVAGSKGL